MTAVLLTASILIASQTLMGASTNTAYAGAGGSVALIGIDAADGGHPATSNYFVLAADMTSAAPGTLGILVFGCTTAGGDQVTLFWAEIATALSETLTCVETAASIAAVPIPNGAAGYSMIGVADASGSTLFGLTNAENDALTLRQPEIAAHVNAGGALLAFAQTGQTTPYGFIAGLGAFTVVTGLTYTDVSATAAGLAVGFTDTSVDGCCWHDTYTIFPAFLVPLLIVNGGSLDGDIAAIGGTGVIIAQDGCTPGFWKNNGEKHEAAAWVTYVPGADGDSSFDATFGTDFPIQWADRGKPQSISDYSLQQALEANGGGLSLLARHGTAALLNAASGDIAYPFTEAEVIALVVAADAEWTANGNSVAFQDIVAQLTDANQQVCTVNQQGGPIF
jgi:hypothetical protein